MTKLVLAVKREARANAPSDLFDEICRIEGVEVLGAWTGRQLQLEVSDTARAEIKRRFGALLHVEEIGTYRPTKP